MTNGGEAWIVRTQDNVVKVSFIYGLIGITHPFPVVKHCVKLPTLSNANHFQRVRFLFFLINILLFLHQNSG